MGIKTFTIVSTALSILLYFADVFSDISLAVKYYENGHRTFSILTFSLVIISAIVSSLLSFYMYWLDNRNNEVKVSKKCWMLRAFFLITGIAPVLRSLDALWFAWKSSRKINKNDKLYYTQRMANEIADGLYLRLYEAFVESGPQLVLQMYILIKMQTPGPDTFTDTEIGQCFITMVISAISTSSSISSAVLAYAKSFNISMGYKKTSKVLQMLFLFLWRFFEVISRIIAMSLGISATPYFHIAFAIRYIITAVLIYFTRNNCNKPWDGKNYRILLLSVINMFVYFNPEENPNKKCYIFYMAMFVENSAIMFFWIYFTSPRWNLMLPAVIVQISSFSLSIAFMVIYYKYFYPYYHRQIKERALEDNLSDVSENAMQNGETSAKIEVMQNDKTTEI